MSDAKRHKRGERGQRSDLCPSRANNSFWSQGPTLHPKKIQHSAGLDRCFDVGQPPRPGRAVRNASDLNDSGSTVRHGSSPMHLHVQLERRGMVVGEMREGHMKRSVR